MFFRASQVTLGLVAGIVLSLVDTINRPELERVH